MIIDRSSVKQTAKSQLKGKQPPVYLVAIAFVVIITILSVLTNRLSGYSDYVDNLYNYIRSAGINFDYDLIPKFIPRITVFSALILLAIQVMDTVIQVSFLSYTMKISRGINAGYKELFSGFEIFIKIIWLSILQGIFIFLWTLLFIIPGLVATFRYSQSYYILFDHPDWTAMQCIRESKRITYGYKGQLFMLELSFLGWIILSNLIASFIIIPVLDIWLIPYIYVTKAAYYDILRNIASNTYSSGPYNNNAGPDNMNF